MTLMQKSNAPQEPKKTFFHLMWERKNYKDSLLLFPLKEVVLYWRDYVRPNYRLKFKDAIDAMLKYDILPDTLHNGETFLLEAFRRVRHPDVITYINQQKDWSDPKKQEIILCYRAFIDWLSEIGTGEFNTDLLFHRSVPQKLDTIPDFMEWRHFIEVLSERNERDGLIARIMLQGQKRVSEVIDLTIDQVDFETKSIRFNDEIIFYEESFMQDLKTYIDSTVAIRNKHRSIFITRTGKKVTRRRINYSFTQVCKQEEIKKITPDSLRGLWNIFMKQKFPPKAIMQSKQTRIEESKKEWQKKVQDMITQETSK